MAGTTTKQGLPYPTATDTPFVHLDMLNLASAIDGRLVTYCTESPDTRPTGAARFNGAPIFCTDTGAYGYWDSSASRWRMFDTRLRSYTPSFNTADGNAGAGGSTVLRGWFQRKGDTCDLKVFFGFGDANGGTSGFVFGYPAGIVPAGGTHDEEWCNGKCYVPNAGGTFPIVVWFQPTGQTPYAMIGADAASPLPWTMDRMRNADPGAALGTSVPRKAGAYAWTNGANAAWSGNFTIA